MDQAEQAPFTPGERRRLDALRAIASIPTAPYHEELVAGHVRRYLGKIGLTPRRDACGNLIVEYRGGSATSTVGQPPVALVAHLDHPGFEIESTSGAGRATATLLGGVPIACFERPVPVRVFLQSGIGARAGAPSEARGRIVGREVGAARSIRLEVQLDEPEALDALDECKPKPASVGTELVAPGDFGIFDLPDYREEGDLVHLRAADDLAGCAAILLTLEALVAVKSQTHVFGVFTRAEETGFVGAAALAQAGLLPPETLVVSLETSRELPGALIGQGPVIRVGDRRRTFSQEAEEVLVSAYERLQHAGTKAPPGARPVLVQRQLMSGGACEATAFGLLGYRATGLVLALGNIHNVGPENEIVPERISARDFLTEVDLLVEAVSGIGLPRDQQSAGLLEAAAEQKSRLVATAGRFDQFDQD